MESDLLFRVRDEAKDIIGLLSRAYEISVAKMPEHAPRALDEGWLMQRYLIHSRYLTGSVAYSLGEPNGVFCKFNVIRCGDGTLHIRKRWMGHNFADVMRLVMEFGIIEGADLSRTSALLGRNIQG